MNYQEWMTTVPDEITQDPLWGLEVYRLALGYLRSTGKDRARYFEYSLREAREARDRYFKARRALKQEVVLHRIKLLTQIVKILTAFVPAQRKRGIREEKGIYITFSDFENEILHSPTPTS